MSVCVCERARRMGTSMKYGNEMADMCEFTREKEPLSRLYDNLGEKRTANIAAIKRDRVATNGGSTTIQWQP